MLQGALPSVVWSGVLWEQDVFRQLLSFNTRGVCVLWTWPGASADPWSFHNLMAAICDNCRVENCFSERTEISLVLKKTCLSDPWLKTSVRQGINLQPYPISHLPMWWRVHCILWCVGLLDGSGEVDIIYIYFFLQLTHFYVIFFLPLH